MNQVWYKHSFLDDPWAALEGRTPGSILASTIRASNGRQAVEHAAADSEEAVGRMAEEHKADVTHSAAAMTPSPVSNRPTLVLPPPRHS